MKHRLRARFARPLAFGSLLIAPVDLRPPALMRDLSAALTPRTADAAPRASAQNAGSLCRRDEQTIFNCEVAGGAPKYISLCGSKQLDNERG